MKYAAVKPLAIMSLVAVAMLWAASPGQAQDSSKQQEPAAENSQPTPPETGPHSGTKPGGMGSTGWTGGRKDTHDGGAAETTGASPGNINNDSEYATGEDLKGPALQFPPSRTPE